MYCSFPDLLSKQSTLGVITMFPITITISNDDQLQAVLRAMAGQAYSEQKAITAEPKVVVKPAPKVEAKAEPKAEELPPLNDNPFDGDTDNAPTVQEVSAAILGLAKVKGRDAAVSILKEYGVAKVPDLKPEVYRDVLESVALAHQ
jgi:hypothetical protein